MTKKMYVCYASSDFYSRETGISLLGFLDNNLNYEPDTVIILDYGILDHNKEKLNSIAAKYGKKIDYIDAKSIMEKVQKDLHLESFRGSLATYSRAFIDKLMPDYVERLLYIDSDTVVVGNASSLGAIDIGDACMAAVVGTGFYTGIGQHIAELQLLTKNKCYYTCGVVLFDIENWKKINTYDMMAKTLAKKTDYPYADQTLINNTIPEKYLMKLPIEYNYTTHVYSKAIEVKMAMRGGWYTEEEVRYAIQHPVVIHYPGNPINRPWYDVCYSRRKDDYLKYRKLSPWVDDPFFSYDEYYKKNVTSLAGKFNNWVHKQEMIASTESAINRVYAIRNCVWKVKKLTEKL